MVVVHKGAIEDHDVAMRCGWIYDVLGTPSVICCVIYSHDFVGVYAIRLE